jgi:galactokinase
LEYEYLPLHTGNYDLVIINTNKPRELADSKYNERFAECQSALKMLRKTMNIDHLCDLTPGEFQRNRGLVETEVLRNRVWHVVTENARVQDAADALRRNDLVQFGELMFVSHESLRHFYEVTGRELDTIIDFCKDEEACIGARMTGAGFGGCAIALMEKKTVADFSNRLKKHYSDVIGYAPDIFIAEIADGVRAI